MPADPDSEWTPETLTQLPTYYLVVAAVKNQLLSVTDARVSFALNKWTRSREGGASWPPLRSCFLAYESPIEVRTEWMGQPVICAENPLQTGSCTGMRIWLDRYIVLYVMQAIAAGFPRHSELAHAPKVSLSATINTHVLALPDFMVSTLPSTTCKACLPL